jgi:hypothetical protein
LIIIPGIIFASHIYLKDVTVSMSRTIGSAKTFMQEGKKKEAAQQVAAFESSWNSNKMIIATFIRHSELDTVNLSAARLQPYLDNDDTGDFCAESESLQVQLKHIWETEKFSLDNVL